jgi:hypothetical protein
MSDAPNIVQNVPLDLSAGMVPKQPVSASPAPLDLSAGMVPKQSDDGTQATPTFNGSVAQAVGKIGDVGRDVATGFVKGAGDTVSGISHLINKTYLQILRRASAKVLRVSQNLPPETKLWKV